MRPGGNGVVVVVVAVVFVGAVVDVATFVAMVSMNLGTERPEVRWWCRFENVGKGGGCRLSTLLMMVLLLLIPLMLLIILA